MEIMSEILAIRCDVRFDEPSPINNVNYNSINTFDLDYDSKHSRIATDYKPCTRFCHVMKLRRAP